MHRIVERGTPDSRSATGEPGVRDRYPPGHPSTASLGIKNQQISRKPTDILLSVVMLYAHIFNVKEGEICAGEKLNILLFQY